MSVSDVEVYEDLILKLAQDPELNRVKEKSAALKRIIHEFLVAERKVSKLCLLSLSILQTLEKIELSLRNWAFISLDINSENHFDVSNNLEIKQFNNSVSLKVLNNCMEHNKKLQQISLDLDYITKSLRTLSPVEFVLDSGVLLTSLTLRNIKLKDELADKLSVAYLKAKLITIGTDLESMLSDDIDDTTVSTYKSFVVSLLKQLNNAITAEDLSEKYECLAVINDMEKMFDAFKLEKAQEAASKNRAEREKQQEQEAEQQKQKLDKQTLSTPYKEITDDEYDFDSESDLAFSSASLYNPPPLIHSITKSHTSHQSSSPQGNSPPVGRRDSFTSVSNSSILHKTTLTEELPYLMTAFNLAKNFEEDVSHYKGKDLTKSDPVPSKNNAKNHKPKLSDSTQHPKSDKSFPTHKSNLPERPLYSDSSILSKTSLPDPQSYLYANNSLLSKLGIRPQVITADIANGSRAVEKSTHKHPLHNSQTGNKQQSLRQEESDKKSLQPLTKQNLESFRIMGFAVENLENDVVE